MWLRLRLRLRLKRQLVSCVAWNKIKTVHYELTGVLKEATVTATTSAVRVELYLQITCTSPWLVITFMPSGGTLDSHVKLRQDGWLPSQHSSQILLEYKSVTLPEVKLKETLCPESAKLVTTLAERGYRVVSVTIPYGSILGFVDRSRYFFFQLAPQSYSPRTPFQTPLLLRKSGSAGNWTRTSGFVARNSDH
jgi:hypothetical protein